MRIISTLVITTVMYGAAIFNVFSQDKKTKPSQNITANEIWIDRFDNATGKALTGGNWFTYNDKPNLGASQIFPEDVTKAYKRFPERKDDMGIDLSYKLNKADFKWEPFVGVGVNIADSNITVGLNSIKGVAYDYKGSGHYFIFQTSTIKDYAHYRRMVPASEEWKTMIIPISELRQPNSWGKPVEFDPTMIEAFQWLMLGVTGDSNTISIDNVRFLRKLPPEPKAEVVTPKAVVVTNVAKKDPPRVLSDKVKIADWSGFRKGAYSLSFDDGLISQYNYVAPILDKHNLKATFYICSETLQDDTASPATWRFGYWHHFIELSKKGHELGSHTATHPKLTELKDGSSREKGTLLYELNAPIDAIQERIPGYQVISFAYPFVDFNAHVMDETRKLYASSRGMGSGFNPARPSQWMNIQSHGVDYSAGRTLVSDMEKFTVLQKWISDNTIARGGWTVLLAHDVMPFKEAVEAADAWHPISSESFDAFAKWLKEKQNAGELWVETVGNITRYIKERDNVSVELISETAEKLRFSIGDKLSDDVYNYPLTLEIKLPSGWNNVKALQKENTLNVSIREGKVIVDAIPDKGVLEISRVE